MIKLIKVAIVILSLCSANIIGQEQQIWSYKNTEQPAEISVNLFDSIIETAKDFLNTKYVYGGCSINGFDCSGFIYYVFKEFNIILSKSASNLSIIGKNVEFENIKEGDLLFFKGRDVNSKHVGHVALVIFKMENSFQMIHATNRGVVIDIFDEISYYQNRFLFARRFMNIERTCNL